MSEKQETEDFDESDVDEVLEDDEEVDLARLAKDMDVARKRGARSGIPALRRLELLAEQRRTAELTSDFDDYDIDESPRARRRASYA